MINMRSAFCSIVICAVLSFANAQNTGSDTAILEQTGNAIAHIAELASPAVVSVRIEKTASGSDESGDGGDQLQDPFDQFFQKFFHENPSPDQRQFHFRSPQPRRRIEGLGSGFIISPDGYIMTNSHVVSDTRKVVVKTSAGSEYTAKVIGTDPPTDLAVIKIEARDLPSLQFGDSDALKVGQWVIAIGNPFGLTSTVTLGVVSAKGRTGIGIEDYEDFIQTDAAINLGNSGGPLIDAHGRVIGINTAIVSQTGGSLGIGFAVPSSMAKLVYTQLREKGSVTRGFLGVSIQQVTPEIAKYFKLPNNKGVLVADVVKSSPAGEAGIKQGDIITALNGNTVESVTTFRNQIAQMSPGSKVDLTIMRNGSEQKMTVKVGQLPSKQKTANAAAEGGVHIGVTVQTLTPDLASQAGVEGQKGVIITDVEPGSPADQANLEPGMVITQVDNKPVASVDDFQSAITEGSKKGSLLFLVKGKEFTGYIVITLK